MRWDQEEEKNILSIRLTNEDIGIAQSTEMPVLHNLCNVILYICEKIKQWKHNEGHSHKNVFSLICKKQDDILTFHFSNFVFIIIRTQNDSEELLLLYFFMFLFIVWLVLYANSNGFSSRHFYLVCYRFFTVAITKMVCHVFRFSIHFYFILSKNVHIVFLDIFWFHKT